MRPALTTPRLALAVLLLAAIAACAPVPPGERKPLPPDYEPPPIDGAPSSLPPSRI